MADPWELPGYDVLAPVGGATGEVWRARERATGELVALRRLRPGTVPGGVEALRRGVALLRSLDTPYVLRPRDVLSEGERPVLVLDHAAGGSLASLLLARRRLDPGEVVTVAVPVAEALAAAHARGLVHGGLTATSVLFTGDGMPLLADLELALVVDRPPADGDPAADVRALAALCRHMLAGTPPDSDADAVVDPAGGGAPARLGQPAPAAEEPLVHAVEGALVADPGDRPDAAAFARSLRRACAATPLRLAGRAVAAAGAPVPATSAPQVPAPGTPAPLASRVRGRRPPQPARVGVAAVLLVGAGLLGWRLGDGPSPPLALDPVGGPSRTPSGVLASAVPRAAPDWSAVLDGLDAARAAAYAAGDPAALAATYAPGSPALATDSAVLGGLAAQGRTALGVRHRLRSVQQVSFDGTTARLRLRDVLDPYAVLGPDGAVLERAPARGEAAFEAVVVRTPRGFRLREVRAL